MATLSTHPRRSSADGNRSAHAGVMNSSYARERDSRAELSYRLRSRAAVVARAWTQFGNGRPPRLLEVGAAEGRTLVEIARRIGGGEYVGVELAADLIGASGRLPANARLERGDAMRLPSSLEGGSFDAVAMLAVLEHLPNPGAALAEALRMLRPGGIVTASCPNPSWDAVAGRLRLVHGSHHVQAFDLAGLRDLIASSGFEVLESKRFMWAPVAALPYLGIPFSPDWGLRVDAWIDRVPFASRLCVNAFVVGRKH